MTSHGAPARRPGAPVARARTRPRTSPALIMAILALTGVSYAVLQSMVAPALPAIQRALGTGADQITWLMTGYLLSAVVSTPIAGRLGDMFGKKRSLLTVIAVLAAGTLVAALADSLVLLIAGRVVQGVGAALFPLAFGIIRDEFPRDRVATGIGLMSSILGIGGGVGIVLAGPILEHFDYHWLFWFPLALIGLSLAAVWLVIPDSALRSPARVHWLGAVLMSGGLGCLLLALSMSNAWGWFSGRVFALWGGAVLLLALWVLAELRTDSPLVDMRMMRLRGVWTTNLAALLVGYAMFASFILIPQLVQLPTATGFGFGAGVAGAGMFMLPSALTMLVAGPLAGRLDLLVGSKPVMLAGCALCAAGMGLAAFVHGQPWQVYAEVAVIGLGIGLSFAAMANLIVEAVPPGQTGVATGVNTVSRNLGGAFGSQLSATLLAVNVAPATRLPGEHGFVTAFAVAAGLVALGFAVATGIPGRRGHGADPAPRRGTGAVSPAAGHATGGHLPTPCPSGRTATHSPSDASGEEHRPEPRRRHEHPGGQLGENGQAYGLHGLHRRRPRLRVAVEPGQLSEVDPEHEAEHEPYDGNNEEADDAEQPAQREAAPRNTCRAHPGSRDEVFQHLTEHGEQGGDREDDPRGDGSVDHRPHRHSGPAQQHTGQDGQHNADQPDGEDDPD